MPPLPPIEKTWQFDVNRTVARSGVNSDTQSKKVFLDIKTALKGFGTLPWTVAGSCNAVAFGMDAVDRLSANGDIVSSSSGDRSWIVFTHPTGLQLCVEFDSTAANLAEFVVSPSVGFTGGALNARPTATDEVQVIASSTTWLRSNAAFDAVVNAWHSDDGENTMVGVLMNSQFASLWIVGRAGDPTTGWTVPRICFVRGGASSSIPPTDLTSTSDRIKARGPSGAMPLRAITRATRHLTSGINGPDWSHNSITGTNGITGSYALWPLGLLSLTTGMKGPRGRIVDMWIAETGLGMGTRYPASGTKTFVQFGKFVFPWNNTTATLA